MRLIPCFVALAALAAPPAFASSEAAWEAFRTQVQEACTALAEVPEGGKLLIEVSPQGSETFGTALVTVGLKDGGADRMICVMDKQSGKAELSAPFLPTEGEGTKGGGMGKAEVKGPTAGDKPASPAAKPAPPADKPATPKAPAGADAPPPQKPAG